MSDPITELILDIQQNGIRWVSIIATYALIRKERRNHYLDLRDKALFHNIKIMMEDRGLGSCFVENPNLNKNMEEALLKHGLTVLSPAHFTMLFTRQPAIKKLISRRKTNMLSRILKANLSKKLISALVSIGVVALNQKFNLGLDESMVFGILGLSAAHITLQTIIDSIKAHAIDKVSSVVAQTLPDLQSVVYKVIADPNTSYAQMVPVISEVHTKLNLLFEDLKKGKVTDATREAMNAYLTFQAYLQTIKPAPPIAAVEQVGA